MDTLNQYRAAIERILAEAAHTFNADPDIEHKTIFDRHADSYAVIAEGWHKARRIHHLVVHLEIINNKVWVQADNTDLALTDELVRAGIPKSAIVLGFHPPTVRPHTEYAVA